MCGESYFNRNHVQSREHSNQRKKKSFIFTFLLYALVTVVAGTRWYRIDWVSMFLHEHTRPQCLFMWKSNKKKNIYELYSGFNRCCANGMDATVWRKRMAAFRNLAMCCWPKQMLKIIIVLLHHFRIAHNFLWCWWPYYIVWVVNEIAFDRNNTIKPNCWTPLYGMGWIADEQQQAAADAEALYSMYIFFNKFMFDSSYNTIAASCVCEFPGFT